MTEWLIDDPALRQRYVFRRATTDAGEECLQIEMWVDPTGGVVPHIHPTFEEVFEVLEGELTFRVGGKKIRTPAGEKAIVPPGASHTYRNDGSQVAHVLVTASPPEPDLQRFLEDAAALGRAGKSTRYGLPRTPTGLLQLSLMARDYRDTTLITMVPPFLHRVLFHPFAWLAERRGYRVGTFAG